MSRRVENQLKYSRFVKSTFESTKEKLHDAYKAWAGAEQAKKVIAALEAVLEQVEKDQRAYTSALEALRDEEHEDTGLRDELRDAQEALERALRQARNALADGFGDHVLATYGLAATPPRARDGVLHYTQEILRRLTDHPKQGDDPFGRPIDTAVIEAFLSGHFKAFEGLHGELDHEDKETMHSREARDVAVERFRQSLVHSAQLLEGALRIVGLDYTADRIRPTVGRMRGDEDIDADSDEPSSPPTT